MVHFWPAQSPEANHTVLASGPGSASTMAHAQELSAQAAGLQALASASQANAAGTYGTAWSGAGATGSRTAHSGVNAALAALAISQNFSVRCGMMISRHMTSMNSHGTGKATAPDFAGECPFFSAKSWPVD